MAKKKIEIDIKDKIILLRKGPNYKFSDKTSRVKAVYMTTFTYRGTTQPDRFIVYYKDSEKGYYYAINCVLVLGYIKDIDPNAYYTEYHEKRIEASRIEQFENKYYRVTLPKEKIIVTNELIFIAKGRTEDIFAYYKELADYAFQITSENYDVDNPDPLYFLARNYGRINYNALSTLHNYFKGNPGLKDKDEGVILPFEYNESQYRAIKTALECPISVIEGPPGTGKTETILNLITNIVSEGKNCAVVSNNNKAVQNVYDKLMEEGYDFLVAKLGSTNKSMEFFNGQDDTKLKNFINNYKGNKENKDYYYLISACIRELRKVNNAELQISKDREELSWINSELKRTPNIEASKYSIKDGLPSERYKWLLNRIEEEIDFKLLERLKVRRFFKIKHFNLKDINIEFVSVVEERYYQAKIKEVNEDIEYQSKVADPHAKEVLNKKIKEYSYCYLDDYLYKHYSAMDHIEFDMYSYKKDFETFLKRYPVVLSTTHSIMNNVSNGFMFDYLIIDEASQADLLSSVLAMNCTKRIVIVGDSKQLQQIDEEDLLEQSEKLAKKYEVPTPYVYNGSNSLLKSIKTAIPDVPTTLLKEHYRCAPDIIRYCNEMFYDGELIPMTENESKVHLHIVKTVEGNHARKNPNPGGKGLYNNREIEEVASIVNGWDKDEYGIITPFVIQSQLINKRLMSTTETASTIHKYQGQQKNKIVLSFVVNSLEKKDIEIENRLYDFITDRALLNVAVSRAKDELYVVISDGVYHSQNNPIHDLVKYIENLYGEASTTTSKIVSVFDYLYKDNNEFFKKLFKEGKYDKQTNEAEALFANLIDSQINNYPHIGYIMHMRLNKTLTNLDGFNEYETSYLTHPFTHTDFMFYNKVSKEPLFVIEIDGVKFHEQNEKQLDHDRIKDRALLQNGINVYRFKTNEANEEERLNSILSKYSYK